MGHIYNKYANILIRFTVWLINREIVGTSLGGVAFIYSIYCTFACTISEV